jgi:mRNA-degrading endonuclease toxin of MazEF toxin-antitoxin module
MATYARREVSIALTFDDQSGHERRERRPALVVSNDLIADAP